jgi:hypothetical protein
MKLKNLLMSMVATAFAISGYAQPTTPAATPPARDPAKVISVFSDAYTNVSPVDLNPNWSQSGFGVAIGIKIMGDSIRQYTNMNYQGIQFPNQNVSALDSVHFDIWSGNCTSIGISLVGNNGGGEREVTRALNTGAWNSISIKLSEYSSQAGFSLSQIFQFKFVAKTPASGANIWVDNMYFFTELNVPTLSNFSIPAKNLGDAPFTITPPTSNSTGAFTYTSSNTNVATVTGNTITIVRAGTSVITANQAAAPPYAAGSITATLSVTVAPISSNAPTPTKPSLNVRSIFSDTYPDLSGTTFRTSWSNAGSTLTDTSISGNEIKKYAGVDFVGIELANPTDLTLADSVHISMWTPSAATFALKLVNQGGGPLNENIVWFDGNPGTHNRPAPLQGQWNVYSLPLSLYATLNGALRLTSRNAIFQILLVGAAPFGDNTYYIDDIYFSSSTNALPVDFKSFEISKTNTGAFLQWTVANEVNVNEYIIEKSLNGRDFSKVGSVAAKGTDKYNFTDGKLQNGTSYYRIKSVDKDGSFKYTAIKSINHVMPGKLDYTIYPNPVKGNLFIKDLSGSNNISILDATGKVVYRSSNVTNASLSIDLSKYSSGLYTVVVNNGTDSKTSKVFVEK